MHGTDRTSVGATAMISFSLFLSLYCIVGGAGPEDDRRGKHSVEGGQGAGGQARLILTCRALEGGETHCSRVCSPNLTLRVTLY